MLPILHVVYCLTAKAKSPYEAMVRISISSVRLTNPGAFITVVCDKETYQDLQIKNSQLFYEADKILMIQTPSGTPVFCSRYIKTQLGSIIKGPFLFLDSDIVVRKPLNALNSLNCDIAAAPNHSRDTLPEQVWSEDQTNLDAMGWVVREPYVNTGVIWYGGTKSSISFSSEWHNSWLANGEKTGRYRDQPAFNHVLSSSSKIQFTPLGHSWNAQVLISPNVSADARIWHTYSSTGFSLNDWFSFCCRQVRSDRPIRYQLSNVRRMVAAQTPQMPKRSLLLWRERISGRFCRLAKRLHTLLQS